MKKLLKRYGATVLFYSGIIAIFVLGFIIGAYGRSAPDAETAELHTEKATSEITSIAEDNTPSEEAPTETPEEQPEETPQYSEITVTATAYCACSKCCGKSDGITATGTQATAGRTIAVDPSFIPFGTEVVINGNTYVAEDRGGAVNGNRVDIFFNTHEEALQFGRRVLTAYVKSY